MTVNFANNKTPGRVNCLNKSNDENVISLLNNIFNYLSISLWLCIYANLVKVSKVTTYALVSMLYMSNI